MNKVAMTGLITIEIIIIITDYIMIIVVQEDSVGLLHGFTMGRLFYYYWLTLVLSHRY